MARLEIEKPTFIQFTTTLPVRVSDLNYGGHLGHDSLLTLMQEARVRWYRHLGFDNEISFEGTVGQIIAEAAIIYKGEAFLGDELQFALAAREPSRFGFEMVYVVTRAVDQKLIALGKTGIVCFDYTRKKIAPIPTVLKDKLAL